MNNGEIKGVLGVCVDKSAIQFNTIDYWIATEYEGNVPENLQSLEIPVAKWAVFEVREAMPDTMSKILFRDLDSD